MINSWCGLNACVWSRYRECLIYLFLDPFLITWGLSLVLGAANPFSGLDDKFVVWIERVRLVEI